MMVVMLGRGLIMTQRLGQQNSESLHPFVGLSNALRTDANDARSIVWHALELAGVRTHAHRLQQRRRHTIAARGWEQA